MITDSRVCLLDMLLALAGLAVLVFSLSPWKEYQTDPGVTLPRSACYLGVVYFTRDGVPTTPVLDYRTVSPVKCERLPLEKEE